MQYLSEKEASQKIIETENTHRLWQYQINGYCVWQLLRFQVSVAIQNLPFGNNLDSSGKIKRIFGLLSDSFSDFFKIIFTRESKFLVMTCSSSLAEESEGRFKDVFFDDLLLNLDSVYKIEMRNSRNYNKRRLNALVKVNIRESIFDLLTGVLARINPPKGDIVEVSEIFSKVIVNDLGLHNYSSIVIANLINSFFKKKYLFSIFLKRLKPQFVLQIDTSRFEITSAAQELGIKVIEFQHGVFTRYHPDALHQNAKPFKNSIIVKDKYFLYGEYWKNTLNENNFYDSELCVVGNPRIDRFKMKRINNSNSGGNTIIKLVLTTQNVDTERLLKFISEFLLLAEKEIPFILYIKLHPSQEGSKKEFESLVRFSKKVLVLLGNEEPNTYELISMAHYHISIGSTCHYDAIGIGVPTIILPFAGHEAVLNLFESGHAFLAKSPEELVKIISGGGNIQLSPTISEFYYRSNAVKNMFKELGLD